MKVQPIPAWSKTLKATTDPSEKTWCGIAIGPGSDDGLIYVDDHPLQAGRILPLRNARYQLTHVRPIDPRMTVADENVHDPALDCIENLSVILFEDPAEMGATVPRPTQNYFTRGFENATANLALALSVPFVGRRQALVVFQSDNIGASIFNYKIKGVRYQYSARKVVRYTGPLNAAALVDENGTLALVVGGYDNQEEWDVLEVYLATPALATSGIWNVDVNTDGEQGAY